MSTWPASLPQTPLAAGYSVAQYPRTTTSPLDTAPERQDRTTVDTAATASASWLMTDEQVDVFAAFFKQQRGTDADFFEIPLYTAAGAVPHSARFAGPYQQQYTNGYWLVSVSLDVAASVYLTEQQTRDMASITLEGMETAGSDAGWMEVFDKAIHTKMPTEPNRTAWMDLFDVTLNQTWPAVEGL